MIGLTPGMGGTQRLASRAGAARAKEFVMTGDKYDAETLHSWGVVNKVWDDDELEANAHSPWPAGSPTARPSPTRRRRRW